MTRFIVTKRRTVTLKSGKRKTYAYSHRVQRDYIPKRKRKTGTERHEHRINGKR